MDLQFGSSRGYGCDLTIPTWQQLRRMQRKRQRHEAVGCPKPRCSLQSGTIRDRHVPQQEERAHMADQTKVAIVCYITRGPLEPQLLVVNHSSSCHQTVQHATICNMKAKTMHKLHTLDQQVLSNHDPHQNTKPIQAQTDWWVDDVDVACLKGTNGPP